MSIRYKFFCAFSVVIALACGLAFHGMRGISTSGDLVVRLYDGPLMGINHARSAHAALNAARLLMQSGLSDGATKEAVGKFEKLVSEIADDLKVVRDRVKTKDVTAALEKAEAAVREWSDTGLKILKPQAGGVTALPLTSTVAKKGDAAIAAVDDLVEMVAAYGFDYRTEAEASVATAHTTMLALAIGTALIGLILAVGFSYSMRGRGGVRHPSVDRPAALLLLAEGRRAEPCAGGRRRLDHGPAPRAWAHPCAHRVRRGRPEARRDREVLAARALDRARPVAAHPRARPAVPPLARRGLRVDRVRAVHEPRQRPRRSLGGYRQDRVRAARLMRATAEEAR